MASTFTLPTPLRHFFSYFPLYSYPPIPSPNSARPVTNPTLWVHVPRDPEADVLSSDVECLKWQAHIALRGLSNILLRWDISPDGAIDGQLPNLHLPPKESQDVGDLLPSELIREWVDGRVGDPGPLEGYIDEAARDESRAWIALLEGHVHAALVLFQTKPLSLSSLLSPYSGTGLSLQTLLNPPPAPLTGLSSLFPPYGTHIDRNAIELRYKEAISSLSERLGTDKWFLGSTAPTALDALVFAYLHSLLHCTDNTLRFEITRRVNLVAWERRVQHDVRAAFQRYDGP